VLPERPSPARRAILELAERRAGRRFDLDDDDVAPTSPLQADAFRRDARSDLREGGTVAGVRYWIDGVEEGKGGGPKGAVAGAGDENGDEEAAEGVADRIAGGGAADADDGDDCAGESEIRLGGLSERADVRVERASDRWCQAWARSRAESSRLATAQVARKRASLARMVARAT
jgi:hypothetical protein